MRSVTAAVWVFSEIHHFHIKFSAHDGESWLVWHLQSYERSMKRSLTLPRRLWVHYGPRWVDAVGWSSRFGPFPKSTIFISNLATGTVRGDSHVIIDTMGEQWSDLSPSHIDCGLLLDRQGKEKPPFRPLERPQCWNERYGINFNPFR